MSSLGRNHVFPLKQTSRQKLISASKLGDHVADHARQQGQAGSEQQVRPTPFWARMFWFCLILTCLNTDSDCVDVPCSQSHPLQGRLSGSLPPVRSSLMSQRRREPLPTSVLLDSPDPNRPAGLSCRDSPKHRDHIRRCYRLWYAWLQAGRCHRALGRIVVVVNSELQVHD
ncbi:hypothetical protein CH063_09385 [Colletotrichum higginsianum]|uniref:Uncharacterized protein n=1 Tax=Colletotrichum higginsianum (strain IMI 349063) TaxID=759273 RepID=H1VDE6_COLHI|nr:hypothetical protein CH063_09385 [Colletotrichum higginsianum]